MQDTLKLIVLKAASEFCRLPLPINRLWVQDKFYFKLRPQRTCVSMKIGHLALPLNLKYFSERRIYFHEYEREIIRWLARTVKPGWTCIDIGANIGYLSLVMAASGGSVIAFEPSPQTFETLCRNAGGIVRSYQLALSDKDQMLEFFDSDENLLSTSIVSLKPANSKSIQVQAITLDSFCAANQIAPSLIKIDVEGAELAALRGMRHTLERFKPVISCEFKPFVCPEETENMLKELVGIGYSIKEWIGGSLRPSSPALAASRNRDVNTILQT